MKKGKKMTQNKDTKQLELKILNVTHSEDLIEKENSAKMKNNFSNENMLFDNLITTNQLAVILHIAPRTIRYWVAINKLPHVKIGNKTMFLQSSLKKWLTEKEVPHGNN